jgi:hypothetical protein
LEKANENKAIKIEQDKVLGLMEKKMAEERKKHQEELQQA